MGEFKYHVQEYIEPWDENDDFWRDISVYDEDNPGDLEEPLRSAMEHLSWLPRSFPNGKFRVLQTTEAVIASA
jgi:hypothetical protein